MNLYFITYGNNLINCYSIIMADSYADARVIAYEGTNNGKYAFMYEGQKELDRQMRLGYISLEIPMQPMEVANS